MFAISVKFVLKHSILPKPFAWPTRRNAYDVDRRRGIMEHAWNSFSFFRRKTPMQILPFFAIMQDPEPLIWFVFSTIAFLLLAGGVLRFSRTAASRLIAVGILLAITSVGYGGFANRDIVSGNAPLASAGYGGFVTPPAAILLSTGLMKIALILVLGGVACAVVSPFGGSPAADAAKSKEPPNEP